jgi:hypothetical protein
MNDRFVTAPGAIRGILITLICLAGILVAEALFGVGAPPAFIAEALAIQPARSVPAPDRVDLASLANIASDIEARPLLAPDRRPPHTGNDNVAALSIAAPPAVRLVGTIVSDGISVAFLEVGDKPVTRFLGDNVGDGRIVAIDPARIRVLADDGKLNDLRLTRGTVVEPPPPQLEPSTRAFHLEQ